MLKFGENEFLVLQEWSTITCKYFKSYDPYIIYYDENWIVCVCVYVCVCKILKLICLCYLLFMLLKDLKTIENELQMFCLINCVKSFMQTFFFPKSLVKSIIVYNVR
jgi:hypothetical protein